MLAFSVDYKGNVTTFQVHPARSRRATDRHLVEMVAAADFPEVLRLRSGSRTKTVSVRDTQSEAEGQRYTWESAFLLEG